MITDEAIWSIWTIMNLIILKINLNSVFFLSKLLEKQFTINLNN